MTMIIDGTNGLTFNNATTKASAGQVLQVVTASTQAVASTTSTSFVSTGLTATITPKFSTSKILVLFSGSFYNANSGQTSIETLYRNSTNLFTYGFSVQSPNLAGLIVPSSVAYVDSPATTSATTYGVYYKQSTSAAAVYMTINGEVASLTLMEIA